MARRGRKRSNLPRYKSGQVKPTGRSDRKLGPTPEFIARRIETTGRSDLHGSWPIDVLRGRDAISEEQAFAGYRYAILHWSCYGPPPSVRGHWGRIALGFSIYESDFAQDDPVRRSKFLAADAALANVGAIERSAVLKAAVFLEPADALPALRSGLDALASHFNVKARFCRPATDASCAPRPSCQQPARKRRTGS